MSFDFLAPHYRWMEAVLAGRTLQRARLRWIDALEGRKRILIIGEGPGRLLGEVLKRFPHAEVAVVELSAEMIGVAQRRLRKKRTSLERVRWINADVRAWQPAETSEEGEARFDAVITPFLLDCFTSEDLERVVEKLGATATCDAVWLLIDFQMPERGWRRWRAKIVHELMYRFFRVATKLEALRLTEPDAALRAAGFELESRATFNAGLVRSDVWKRV